jgi:hypothetical protein
VFQENERKLLSKIPRINLQSWWYRFWDWTENLNATVLTKLDNCDKTMVRTVHKLYEFTMDKETKMNYSGSL